MLGKASPKEGLATKIVFSLLYRIIWSMLTRAHENPHKFSYFINQLIGFCICPHQWPSGVMVMAVSLQVKGPGIETSHRRFFVSIFL